VGGDAHAERREFSFPFAGLRSELARADAVIGVDVNSWVPDSALGLAPGSHTWQREVDHVTVRGAFGVGPFRPGDTLAISVAYHRFNEEFYELEAKTQQFVFEIAPPVGFDAILLLRHDASGWEATRGLHYDSVFVMRYLASRAMDDTHARAYFARRLVDEFLSEAQHWGHIRVLQDDLDRLGAYEPGSERLWQQAVTPRAGDFIRLAGKTGATPFVQLARYLPERDRRECVRGILREYDNAVRALERLKGVDMSPPELTDEVVQVMNAQVAVSDLPEAMEALTPAEYLRAARPSRATTSLGQEMTEPAVVLAARRYVVVR
jgi:hypothetical protein